MSDLDLEAIEARVERARSAESWDDWNLERDALTDSVGDVPTLVAEVRRLRGDLTEQGDRLRETLAKRDELRERLEYAQEAEAELKQSVAARDRLLSAATGDRAARDRKVAAAAIEWAAGYVGDPFGQLASIAHQVATGQLEVPS